MTLSGGYDPIDALELGLIRDRRIRLEALFPPSKLEVLPAIVELAALRWYWHRERGTDLFDHLSGLRSRMPMACHGQVGLLGEPSSGSYRPTEETVKLEGGELVEIPTSESAWQAGQPLPLARETFSRRLRRQGCPVGFAYGLAGAFSEMASNAVEHAASPIPPVACLQVTKHVWAFSVTDVGRGIRASLSENPRFASLKRDSDALAQALRDGVSRLDDPARGRGFSTVFKTLVDSSATLRFRSSAAVGWWSGSGPTSQKILIQSLPATMRGGFHVCVSGRISRRGLTGQTQSRNLTIVTDVGDDSEAI